MLTQHTHDDIAVLLLHHTCHCRCHWMEGSKLLPRFCFLRNSTSLRTRTRVLRFGVKLLATWICKMETPPRSLIHEPGTEKRMAGGHTQPRYLAETFQNVVTPLPTLKRKIQRQIISYRWPIHNTGIIFHATSAKRKFVSFRNFEAGDGPVINHRSGTNHQQCFIGDIA